MTLAAADGAGSERLIARRPTGWSLRDLFVGRAVAQGGCPAEVADVLACALSANQATSSFNCSRVDTDTCGFVESVRIPSGGIATLGFAQDENGNGEPDEDEPGAFPADDQPFPICNGDRIVITDVTIDFTPGQSGDGEWTAASIEKEVDGCPAATATPTPTAGDTPTPTPTGTEEPTATPTATATP
ncbi:MAG: hypothetical protein ACREQ9_10175 [Candidatus Binatia bacterium]